MGEGNGSPFQGSCLENPRYGGAWWAAVSGVAEATQQQQQQQQQHKRKLSVFLFVVLMTRLRDGNGIPFQYSFLENPMDGGAW